MKAETENLRQIKALKFPLAAPRPVPQPAVKFEWHDPATLFVEQDYQRNLSARSISMIGRIIDNWDWCAVKPPICTRTKSGRIVIIDGQHTAIAAVTHGGVEAIPVMLIPTDSIAQRAQSFLRHNIERTNITHLQMHSAALAAGDPVAQAVNQACAAAGVTVRKSNPSCSEWGRNETVSIVQLQNIADSKGVPGLTRVLKMLVKADRRPIAALELRALSHLLFTPKLGYSPPPDGAITTRIMSRNVEAWADYARKRGRAEKIPAFKALAWAWAHEQ